MVSLWLESGKPVIADSEKNEIGVSLSYNLMVTMAHKERKRCSVILYFEYFRMGRTAHENSPSGSTIRSG
jgi:hypothetical protein